MAGKGTEIGVAYLSLAASTGDFAKNVKQAFGDMTSVGEVAGDKASGGFWSKVSKGLLGGVGLAIGNKVAQTIGSGLSAGFTRAINIENAQKKLEGLGHSAESVSGIMDSALKSVSGTAYGLGDAASVAAMMTASGVQEGEQLTRTLKAVADVAAISGRGLTDVGLIFGSIAARGKLQGDDMRQLMAAGIPVTSLLAEKLGTTQEAVTELVSKGKIDFETFQAAMELGMGGAALKTGETFQGSLANVQAALSRLGAAALTPSLSLLTRAFQSAIPAIDGFTAKAKPLIALFYEGLDAGISSVSAKYSALTDLLHTGDFTSAFREAFNVEEDSPIVDFLFNVRESLGSAGKAATLFWHGLNPATNGYGTLEAFDPIFQVAKQISETFFTATTDIGLAWKGLTKQFGDMDAFNPIFQSALNVRLRIEEELGSVVERFMGIANGLKDSFLGLSTDITNPFTQIGSNVGAALKILKDGFTDLGPALAPLLSVLSPIKLIFTALQPVFPQIVSAVSSLLPPLATLAVSLGTSLAPVAELVVSVMTQIATEIAALIPMILPLINQIVGIAIALAPLIGTIISQLIPAILPIIEHIIPMVGQVIEALIPIISSILDAVVPIVGFLIDILMPVILSVLDFVTPILDSIMQVVQGAMTFIQGIIDVVMGVISGDWSRVWEGIKEVFSGIWEALGGILNAAWEVIKAAFTVALEFIKGIWSKAWGWVSDRFTEIWDKITGAVDEIKTSITKKFDDIVSWFKGLPEKIKTALGNLGSLLMEAGRNIISGLLKGITEKFQAVQDFVGGIGSWIADHKGPKAYDLALLVPNGGWIMTGLSEGLKDQLPGLKTTLGLVTDTIQSVDFGTLLAPSITASDYSTVALGASIAQPDLYEATDAPDSIEGKLDQILDAILDGRVMVADTGQLIAVTAHGMSEALAVGEQAAESGVTWR